MSKRIAVAFSAIIALLGAVWGGDILSDRSYQLAIVGPAPLYSLPPHQYPASNPVAATLRPGQSIRVLRLRYGKDFQAFRVETADGRDGWVIGGEGIKVVSHGWSS
jgi:hypothetical protein